MKKKIIPMILTLIIGFIMFYVYLPAVNFQSSQWWEFLVMFAVVALILNSWTILKGFSLKKGDDGKIHAPNGLKTPLVLIFALIVIYFGGNVLSSPILRAGAYSELIDVKNGVFSEDIHEADFSKIPILDKDSAERLAEREMGSLVDMVSQYEVADFFTQINYKSRPVRVTPLEYGNEIKWLTNRKIGIPAYISIDMTTQDVECIKLEDGIKISPSELLGRDLARYIRFRYPTYMFRGYNFEIDDNGDPYWICPVESRTIGLFGGADVKGAVVLNAVTGEHQYYDIADVPQWIDKVYDAELLTQQYNYYGTLRKGFINSVFGQRDCFRVTDGYNYLALDDDVWVYTGVTSVVGDQSNVGFVLMNQRTKETNFYPVSGAEEFSAMSSAEGQVQHLGYVATFPLLLNVGGEPTYFLALKDSAGLVKKYAMVNIAKYQIVATGDSVAECERAYRSIMADSGYNTIDISKSKDVSGVISVMKDVVRDGNTYYYVTLENDNTLYEIKVSDNIFILKKNIGDTVKFNCMDTSVDGVSEVISLK